MCFFLGGGAGEMPRPSVLQGGVSPDRKQNPHVFRVREEMFSELPSCSTLEESPLQHAVELNGGKNGEGDRIIKLI